LGALLRGLLDANCDEAEKYCEQKDDRRTKDSVLTHRILPSNLQKTSQRKRGVERLGKTGVSLSVVERSSLNSGASNPGAKRLLPNC
jgi:hypothetical protein